MALINKVNEMRQVGKSDSQIAMELEEIGFSPKDIDDALAQSRIKSAIFQDPSTQAEDMQQSKMPMSEQSGSQAGYPAQEAFEGQNYYSPYSPQYSQEQAQIAQQQSNQQTPQGYYPESYQPYDFSGSPDSETVSEIAEQIAEEKFSKIKTDIEKIKNMKPELDTKIELLKERLKRIEGIIDSLQDSIIRKMGEYSENIKLIGKDLKNTQDSFSKVVKPIVEKTKNQYPKLPRVSSGRRRELLEE